AFDAQDRLPGVDLHEIAAEERDQGGEQQQWTPASRLEAGYVGIEESEDGGRGGDDERQTERQKPDRPVVLEHTLVVVEIEVGGDAVVTDAPEAHEQEIEDRPEIKNREDDQRWQDQQIGQEAAQHHEAPPASSQGTPRRDPAPRTTARIMTVPYWPARATP